MFRSYFINRSPVNTKYITGVILFILVTAWRGKLNSPPTQWYHVLHDNNRDSVVCIKAFHKIISQSYCGVHLIKNSEFSTSTEVTIFEIKIYNVQSILENKHKKKKNCHYHFTTSRTWNKLWTKFYCTFVYFFMRFYHFFQDWNSNFLRIIVSRCRIWLILFKGPW